MTTSCVSASRRKRDKSSLTSERGTSFTLDFRTAPTMAQPPVWAQSYTDLQGWPRATLRVYRLFIRFQVLCSHGSWLFYIPKLQSTCPYALLNSKQPPFHPMQSLESLLRHEHQLSHLYPRLLIGRDDVRLDDAGHSRFEGHVGQRSRGPAFGSEHGREVAAAEAVHEVIVYR